MPDTERDDQRGQTAARISRSSVQLVREYTGRGPTKAHTIINRDSVTIVLQDALTKGERRLARQAARMRCFRPATPTRR